MNSVKCVRCGLVNWAEAGECRRCGDLLALLEEVREDEAAEGFGGDDAAAAAEGARVCSFCGTEFRGYFCPLCRKHAREAPAMNPDVEKTFFHAFMASTKAKVVAAAALAVVVAAFVLFVKIFGGGGAEKFQAELIQKSDDFTKPVAVTFAERGDSPAAPGAQVLRELGLVSIRTVETSPEPEAEDQPGADEVEPEHAPAPARKISFAFVELTAEGLKESGGWKSREPSAASQPAAAGARVWEVPVGGREFLEVRRVYPTSQGVYELSSVEFTWRWRPNHVGRYFDVRSEEHARLGEGARRSAATFNLDSEAIRGGRATLHYDGKRWGVRDVTFEGVEVDAAPATAAKR